MDGSSLVDTEVVVTDEVDPVIVVAAGDVDRVRGAEIPGRVTVAGEAENPGRVTGTGEAVFGCDCIEADLGIVAALN